jgi:hypothetical protein
MRREKGKGGKDVCMEEVATIFFFFNTDTESWVCYTWRRRCRDRDSDSDRDRVFLTLLRGRGKCPKSRPSLLLERKPKKKYS